MQFPNAFVNQQHLAAVLKALFGEYHIITNARKGGDVKVGRASQSTIIHSNYGVNNADHSDHNDHMNVSFGATDYLELDFWIPALRLAFEYQDPHHYISTHYAAASITTILQNDKTKKKIMKDRGDDLIIVPCWWKGDIDSLVATIRNDRHDLFEDRPLVSAPISPTPPEDYFKVLGVPEIGELMIPSFPRSVQCSIIGWWVNEKYDGVRIFWHCTKQCIYSRFGRTISTPEQMKRHLPAAFLDGEAWVGRGGFNEIQKVLRNHDELHKWESLRMPIFDAPNPSLDLDFEHRIANLLFQVHADNPIVLLVSNIKCNSDADGSNMLMSVLQHEGEGIVARMPKSKYQHGLSDMLWKFKASRDMDALVVGQEQDGSFLLKLANDLVFKSKVMSGIPAPTIGQVVSLSYSKYSASSGPINPKIICTKEDINWEDVVSNSLIQNSASAISEHSSWINTTVTASNSTRLAAGHWTQQENVKHFFDAIATKYNFDPNDTLSWYSYSIRDIIAEGGGSMLARYSQSPLQALRVAYPTLEFVPHMFSTVPRHYWSSASNRRLFLLNYARNRGFDALIPTNWYGVTTQDLMKEKGGIMVLLHHNKSVANTLSDLFPNIGIDIPRFKAPRGYFTSITSQRNFLEDFAHKAGLNPLNSAVWRDVTRAQVASQPGGAALMNKHKTLPAALSTLFPELDGASLRTCNPKNHWNDSGNRRQYFEAIAKQAKFDPLNASAWYSVSLLSFVKQKGYKSILNYYNGELAAGLLACFPNMNPALDAQVFRQCVLRR